MPHPVATIFRAASQPRLGSRLKPARLRRRELHLDPLSPAGIADPTPVYRSLHERGDIHYLKHRELWLISGHAAVRKALIAHDALSSADGVTELRAPLPMLITIDRPDHARLRRIVAPQFTGAAAQRWRPLMEAIVDEALDRMVATPGSDAVAELAMPLPIRTIATILGIPARDFDVFRGWSDDIVEGFNGGVSIRRTMRATPSILRAVHRLHAYLRVHFEERRDRATDDLIGRLVTSTGEGTLSDDELFWFVLLLLVAGNETTTNLIGSMLHALAERPALYERLRDEPELIPSVVEEALRWGSPIQGFFRGARTDHGPIPAGSRVLLLFAAANRDPRVYPDPDEFVLDRNPTDHVAFGTGIHFCLGAHLARVEGAVVLEQLLARVDRIEPAGPPVWTANPILRGLARLPLRLSPSDPGAR